MNHVNNQHELTFFFFFNFYDLIIFLADLKIMTDIFRILIALLGTQQKKATSPRDLFAKIKLVKINANYLIY